MAPNGVNFFVLDNSNFLLKIFYIKNQELREKGSGEIDIQFLHPLGQIVRIYQIMAFSTAWHKSYNQFAACYPAKDGNGEVIFEKEKFIKKKIFFVGVFYIKDDQEVMMLYKVAVEDKLRILGGEFFTGISWNRLNKILALNCSSSKPFYKKFSKENLNLSLELLDIIWHEDGYFSIRVYSNKIEVSYYGVGESKGKVKLLKTAEVRVKKIQSWFLWQSILFIATDDKILSLMLRYFGDVIPKVTLALLNPPAGFPELKVANKLKKRLD